jgi:HPt (histidine-containing phosphotransfer) domain-containing protein
VAADNDLPDIDPDALARAEAALAGLQETYRQWVRADMARLEQAWLDGDRAQMFTVAHDMKGQAATFGYPRVTQLAGELCRLLKGDGAGRVAEVVAELKGAVEG